MVLSVDVDIRIVNEEEETVYEGTKSIQEQDFGYYSSNMEDEQLMANVKISPEEIKKGRSQNGKVYFTVSVEDTGSFEESVCDVYMILPVDDAVVNTEPLPKEINQIYYDGSVIGTVRIDALMKQTWSYPW